MRKIKKWLKQLWAWISRKKARELKNSSFREFVYLDEISVLSLLVSREGELTEQIQEGYTWEESTGSEIGSSIGTKETNVSSKSNYQTKSSESVQATRKASIQSQFRRLHQRAKDASLLFPVETIEEFESEADLLQSDASSRKLSDLVRGNLVELEVRLRADPLFSMGSIITEVAEMSAAHPEIFGGNLGGLVPSQMNSYARLLDRFMAGLVPIRSIVTNVRLYESGGEKYLVDATRAIELNLSTKEIELVGVLEKDRFWKDIRRVLFSDARVTVLGRVSVDGINHSWTPVKLLDLFAQTIPNGHQIVSAFQNISFEQSVDDEARRPDIFKAALAKYASLVVSETGPQLSQAQQHTIDQTIEENKHRWDSTEAQRLGFRNIADQLEQFGVIRTPDEHVALRELAKTNAGIAPLGNINVSENPIPGVNDQTSANLLEVEVVAMYW